MKTNKIKATIVIEIEDNRCLASRCWCPMTKERILQDINIGGGDYFTSKETIIPFEETNPLTDSDIRIDQAMSSIEESVDICTLHSSVLYRRLDDEIDNWNWRQDYTN
jgi:hypothetical protein